MNVKQLFAAAAVTALGISAIATATQTRAARQRRWRRWSRPILTPPGAFLSGNSTKATEKMNLRLDKYGNDVGIVDSLGGAKSATRVRRKKRDLPRRDLGRGIRESMDEEAIAELYAGRRYDKPLRPRPAHGNGGGNGGGHGGGTSGAHGGGNGIGHISHGDGNGFGHDKGHGNGCKPGEPGYTPWWTRR